MKKVSDIKLSRFLRILILNVGILCSVGANAQSIGVGIATGYDFSGRGLGINLKGYWNMTYRLSLGLEGDYFPDVKPLAISANSGRKTLLHLNLRYNIYPDKKHNILVYPLAGISFIHQSEIIPALNENTSRVKTVPGLNLGLGVGYKVGNILFFGEYRHTVSQLTTSFLNVGILIKDIL